MRRALRNPMPLNAEFDELLATMVELRTKYQYAHWNASSYQDHLLFERLYKSLDEDIDTMAELSVYAKNLMVQRTTPDHDATETEIIHQAKSMLRNVDQGMENFLLNLIQNRQRAIYLLRLAAQKSDASAMQNPAQRRLLLQPRRS